jgi:hypothetical protein
VNPHKNPKPNSINATPAATLRDARNACASVFDHQQRDARWTIAHRDDEMAS